MTANRPRILIIDDNESDRLLLARSLQDEYDVVTAGNGFEGLGRAISDPQPDVILLDIMMAEVDGYKVLERLKNDEATRDIPVVFLTVKDDELEEVRGLEMGAADYITKPCSIPVVAARIESQLMIRRQAKLLETLAQLDPLTELANRRRYDEVLQKELGRARRAQTPLTLIVVDVDDFKSYNDRYGHAAGDACLRLVAGALQSASARSGDVAARTGGDEFALILPDTDEKSAHTVAERILDHVAELAIPHEGSDPAGHVSTSLGVATATPPVIKEVDELVVAADTALRRAKDEGCGPVEFERVGVGQLAASPTPPEDTGT
jgi:diguanylate cyclase (GGDEF)-like protein